MLLLEGLQVGEVGQAVGAGDGLQVEFDVVLEFIVEHLEEVAAELLAGRAGETFAAPDGAEGVIIAQGGNFGGWALDAKNGRLK